MNKSLSLKPSDSKVIRELGFGECLYDNELLNNNMFQTRAFIATISKEYLLNMEILNKALRIWIKIHPLLQSTVYREKDPSTGKPRLGLPRYFVYMKKSLEEYNNIEILQETDEFKWTDLIEKELKTPFDYINGPLWRLKVLEIKQVNNENFNKFAFVLATSHAISDGKNGYSIGVQFLDILIDTLENKLTDEIVSIPSEFSCDYMVKEYKKRPDFKEPDETPEFDQNTHRLPDNCGNKNGVHGKFDFIFLEKHKIDKLIKNMKSKAPKAKVTSLLLILLCDSYKRICVNYKVNNIPLDRVQVVVLASLRDKLGIKNTQMGCYSAPLFSNVIFEKEITKSQSAIVIPDVFLNTILFAPKYIFEFVFKNIVMKSSWLKKGFFKILPIMSMLKPKKTFKNDYTNLSDTEIWSLAEQETLSMHKNITNNVEMKNDGPDEFFMDLINNNFDFGNNTVHSFCLSNYGIMNNTKNVNVVKLNEHYVSVPCVENRFGAVLQFGVSTVDNNLNIGICFNEKIFSVQFVKDLKKDLLDKIDALSG